MKEDQTMLEILKKELKLMNLASKALKRSWLQCQKLSHEETPIEKMDALELLASRFSRLTDFMIARIFRIIDELDLDSSGTVRDVIHRAEKKELIESSDTFIEARILRNRIAHEYVERVMTEIFEETIRLVPALLNAVEKVNIYCQRYSNQ